MYWGLHPEGGTTARELNPMSKLWTRQNYVSPDGFHVSCFGLTVTAKEERENPGMVDAEASTSRLNEVLNHLEGGHW